MTSEELRAEAHRVIALETSRTHPGRIARLDQLAAVSRARGDDGAALMAEGLRALRAGTHEAAGLAADMSYIGASLVLSPPMKNAVP